MSERRGRGVGPTIEGRARRLGGSAGAVAFATLIGFVAGCAAPKPPSDFEVAFEDETKPWVEIQTQLPPAPRPQDLVTFAVSGASDFRFGLDASSLTVGTDGVYRYVLVATSSQGSRNVSYEGIRCESREKKLYATGRPDGTWVRARNAAWTPIEDVGLNRQQAALLKEYFCPDAYATQDLADILSRLRVKQPNTNIN